MASKPVMSMEEVLIPSLQRFVSYHVARHDSDKHAASIIRNSTFMKIESRISDRDAIADLKTFAFIV